MRALKRDKIVQNVDVRHASHPEGNRRRPMGRGKLAIANARGQLRTGRLFEMPYAPALKLYISNAYVVLLRRFLTGSDIAISIPDDKLTLRLRRGALGAISYHLVGAAGRTRIEQVRAAIMELVLRFHADRVG
jgi:hypothetical protein